MVPPPMMAAVDLEGELSMGFVSRLKGFARTTTSSASFGYLPLF
jgi:hypothetical protein